MQIGVRELVGVPATLALTAWGIRAFAQEGSREGKGEPLFADPRRTMQQQARRQSPATRRLEKPVAEKIVSEERNNGHAGIWVRTWRAARLAFAHLIATGPGPRRS